MEDGMQLLPNPSREQQQRQRQQQQQPAAHGAAAGRAHGGSSSGAADFLTHDDAPIFDEFCEVWFWRDEGEEIGPLCIRDLRRLVKNLPGDFLMQMNNTECYTKQAKPEHKLLKHLRPEHKLLKHLTLSSASLWQFRGTAARQLMRAAS
jgi:hypothetical protein